MKKRNKLIILFFIVILSGYLMISFGDTYAFAFSVLHRIKSLRGEEVTTRIFNEIDAEPVNHDRWTELLIKYVSDNGNVDYKGIKNNISELNEYLDYLSHSPPSDKWTENEQLAYWINAYNAFTIKLIIDHYPVNSIKDIGGNIPMINSPWDIKFFKIGGILFDLNTIEHNILRESFDEPRIHFAINCASVSCPILRREAYYSLILNQQLREQTIQFLMDTSNNRISEERLQLSEIFRWFKSDFIKKQTLSEFINLQLDTKISNEEEVSYLKYDWTLNDSE